MALRVLLVEDSRTQAELLRHALAAAGVEVETAGSGGEALELARGATFDGVASKVVLPDMDGFEAIRRIRAAAPAPAPAAFVLGLGHEQESARRAAALGATYLPKSAPPAEIARAIAAAARAHSRRVAEASARDPSPPLRGASSATAARTRRRRASLADGGDAAAEPPPPRRVLVAEDEKVNQLLARHHLESLGLEVEIVEDGEEALAALARQAYACVLMDCHMPRLDGFAATARIRGSHASWARVPIVALTAGDGDDDRKRCLAAGMTDFVAKPASRRDLERVLARCGVLSEAPREPPPGTR